MKKDHRSEVFAWAAVVRTAFDDFETRGRALPDPALAALDLVEAWLTGKEIDVAQLQSAADLSHEEGVAYVKREKDRALNWIRTAAGNLAWYAKKDRGWQNADASILDAAVNAISSLGGDGNEEYKKFTAIHEKALANVPAAAASTKKKLPKVNPLSTNLSAFIGAAANKSLAKLKPVFDLEGRGSEAELREILTKNGYPIHAAVIAYDARYGGLVTADSPGEEGYDWLFGAYACLKSDAHSDPRGEKKDWVPVAYSPNDDIFFLDENGVAWVLDTIEGGVNRFADDADSMMAKIFTRYCS